MVNLKKQKRILFVPIVNCLIIFIIVFKNKHYLKHGWQFKLLPYCIIGVLLCFPFIFINENILASYYDIFVQQYGFSWIIGLIEFYPFSVICDTMLLVAQKKLIKPEYKKLFIGQSGDGSVS